MFYNLSACSNEYWSTIQNFISILLKKKKKKKEEAEWIFE